MIESKKPITPSENNARMTIPTGIDSSMADEGTCVYTVTAIGGGGVKVGKRVLVGTILNCSARTGSMVEVGGGTGVGGGSTMSKIPGGET